MAVIESEIQDKKTRLYRSVFNTVEGKEVLADMLVELNVFSSIPADDLERNALRNYGVALMYNLGILVDGNIEGIIDKLLSLDYKSMVVDKEK